MECAYIPKLPYGEFSERLHKKMAEQRVPISGSLELTMRCNFHCLHCYVEHGNQGIPGMQELSTAEVKRVIDEIVDAGCLWLLITGGDPLVRRDFPEIWQYAKQKGLILTLFTNGSLITPRLADFLAEWKPFQVEITLYGATQETYEKVTGIPGSQQRALRGIDLLLERNIPLKLKSFLMTHNAHELPQMQAYAESKGVKFYFDTVMNYQVDGSARPMEVRLPLDQVIEIEANDDFRREHWAEYYPKMIGRRATHDSLYLCSAGINSFHIDPYGQLSLCILERSQSYDLRQGSFHSGWRDFLPSLRQRPHSANYGCGQCDLRYICNQCPAMSWAEHQNLEQKSDYLCALAHARARTFIPAAKLPIVVS